MTRSSIGRLLATVSLLVTTAACGGEGGGSNITGPTVQPYTQTTNGSVDPLGTVYHPLTIPRSGTMTLRLSWPNGSTDLDLYLAPTWCNQLSSCSFVASSETSNGTNESITRNVAEGETFRVWIGNFNFVTPSAYTLSISIN
jgi:hypothetical protein